ncbi:uncharacterized protein EKO05_0009264 [Ascochyta rabiei]|uniref:Uncharacterized protein n=1 Tax=Didymella rabiei TaxID=5454 RepID=A0A163EWE1_DIDRA|nr:uncharacterized protein EKO05_0009264 [Ascochyta rabiei]KZM23971.1 hypothetical protein ST47_g4844 [Ascochyta rabiei]UPX18986.1 hypothetical protein EKO05_0009264 [Ascochyta rabiei]
MSHGADFCGDRLRLPAFLRVVDDGLPKRPTRLRRRLPAVGNGFEASSHDRPDHTDSAIDSAAKAAYQGYSDDVLLLGIERSTTSGQPLPAREELSLFVADKSAYQRDREHIEPVLLTSDQPTEKRASVKSLTTDTKVPNKPCKALSTQKRRQLPLNELNLMRSTSSDGLPQPSDADNIFAAPVAAGDPIEDGQVVSCVSLGTAHKLLASHQVGKYPTRSITKTFFASSTKRSGLILRGQLGRPSSVQRNGAHHKKLSTYTFATASDGFVGAELSIQRRGGLMKPQNHNKTRRKKTIIASARLVLASGHLPIPPVEHHVQALPVEHRMSPQGQARISDRQSLSERALTGIPRTMSENEAKELYDHDLRRGESSIRDQHPSIAAPIRRVSGILSSQGFGKKCVPSNGLYSDNSDAHHATWPS